jgi:hypothetical protein
MARGCWAECCPVRGSKIGRATFDSALLIGGCSFLFVFGSIHFLLGGRRSEASRFDPNRTQERLVLAEPELSLLPFIQFVREWGELGITGRRHRKRVGSVVAETVILFQQNHKKMLDRCKWRDKKG